MNEEDLYDEGLTDCGEDIVVVRVCLVADDMWYCRVVLDERTAAPGKEVNESIDLLLARRQRAQI
jgi:hypothetical protein